MDLRHLRYFTTVAAEGSFSRAAEKLNIAQPPLSRQIQQLEEELGVRLLDRGRPISMTEAGRYLFDQGLQVLQRVEEMRAMTTRIGMEVRDVQAATTSIVSISMRGFPAPSSSAIGRTTPRRCCARSPPWHVSVSHSPEHSQMLVLSVG